MPMLGRAIKGRDSNAPMVKIDTTQWRRWQCARQRRREHGDSRRKPQRQACRVTSSLRFRVYRQFSSFKTGRARDLENKLPPQLPPSLNYSTTFGASRNIQQGILWAHTLKRLRKPILVPYSHIPREEYPATCNCSAAARLPHAALLSIRAYIGRDTTINLGCRGNRQQHG